CCGARRLLGSEPPGWPNISVASRATPPAAAVATRDLLDRLVDQVAVLGHVQRLADHLLSRGHDQARHLAAHRLKRAVALGLDLLAGRLGDAPRILLSLLLQFSSKLFTRPGR